MPYCVLERKDTLTPIVLDKVELHVAANDYKAKQPDELTINKTEFVEVQTKSATGFWKVKYVFNLKSIKKKKKEKSFDYNYG